MTSPMVATPVQLRSTGRLSFCSFPSSASGTAPSRRRFGAVTVRASAETMATEKLGIKVGVREEQVPVDLLRKETCYLLQGKVKVYPDGHGEEFVEIAAGDLVVFPKGMSCTWDVAEAVDKHYNFE
ncbi:hypothetical protein Zm00014a_023941 [Zea mays]|uniref:(S)-ureidoglycine aminohydrolase cupin domain-containing protein n=1 Tax=Zea mays TaxID=4577 RepID=A0A3L6G4G3_MAIZE|nr:hypothetical protein Zm00014a_023941 [Zea mays]